MNIFWLDDNIDRNVEMYHNSHVNKILLELGQMLSTAHRVLDDSDDPVLYKKTHMNHPCNIWIRKSSSNYIKAYKMFVALANEYTFRTGKVHKTFVTLATRLVCLPENIINGEETCPPLCMPDQYKTDNVVESYRNYYIAEKLYRKDGAMNKWTGRQLPLFVQGDNNG